MKVQVRVYWLNLLFGYSFLRSRSQGRLRAAEEAAMGWSAALCAAPLSLGEGLGGEAVLCFAVPSSPMAAAGGVAKDALSP
jgi:CBS-domain-containing membrane protein